MAPQNSQSNTQPSLQEKYAPKSICFGCGPANKEGLRIRSQDEGEWITCTWTPEPKHHAFPGVLNGGIIGSLLDCHCNWTAAYGMMRRLGLEQVPCTVTAEYTIKMLRPTPVDGPVHFRARVVEFVGDDRAWVEGEMYSGVGASGAGSVAGAAGNASDTRFTGKITATCRGLFVAVKPGHPAYHRWS